MLYVYFACHGAADNRQYILLNEKQVEKIFWPAEAKIKSILARAGSNCKSIVVYDCCREDLIAARKRVVEAHKKIEAKQEQNKSALKNQGTEKVIQDKKQD